MTGSYCDPNSVTVQVLNGVATTEPSDLMASFDIHDLPDGAEGHDIPAYFFRQAGRNRGRDNSFNFPRLKVAAGTAVQPQASMAAANDQDTPLSVAGDALAQARARLAAFTKRVSHGTGSVEYIERDRVVLRDAGPKIFVAEEEPSDEDILAMLIAAQEKFGDKFRLFGTPEFVERCSHIALVHEIKMHNYAPVAEEAHDLQRLRAS
jgi:hypothetical protein